MRLILRNLTLSQQLALSPIVASLSMLAVIAAGMVFGAAYGRLLSDLEFRLYPTRELVVEIENDFITIQQMLQDAAGLADLELVSEAEGRFSSMQSSLREGIERGLRPPADLADIEEKIGRHIDLAIDVTEQLISDDYEDVATETLTSLVASYNGVVEDLRSWKASTGSKIQDFFRDSKQLGSRLLYAMIGLGVFAGVLMIWLARAVNHSISAPIGAVLDLADRATKGDLRVGTFASTDTGVQDGGVGRLKSGIVAMMNGLVAIVRESKSGAALINSATRDLSSANQDLQRSAEHQRTGLASLKSSLKESSESQMAVREHAESLTALAEDSNRSLSELDVLIRSTDELAGLQSECSESLASSITELASATMQSSTNADSLRSATDSTERALDDLEAADEKTRLAAKTTHDASTLVYDRATEGLECVEASSNNLKLLSGEFEALCEVVSSLGKNSVSIGNVVDILESIVGDTSLLALNASIVAAQAGGQSGAFSVVANELRMLADRASDSTREIRDLLSDVRDQIQGTVESTDRGREFVLASLSHSEQEREVLAVVLDGAALSVKQMETLVTISGDQEGLLNSVAESANQVRSVATELAAATHEQTQTADRVLANSGETRDRANSMREALNRANDVSARVAEASRDVAERSRMILDLLSKQHEQVSGARSDVNGLNEEAEVGARAGSDLCTLVAQLETRSEALERITARFSIDD